MLLTGFCNGKRRFGIPVDILFELMLHYKQARGVGRKAPDPAFDDTGIRLSSAADRCTQGAAAAREPAVFR